MVKTIKFHRPCKMAGETENKSELQNDHALYNISWRVCTKESRLSTLKCVKEIFIDIVFLPLEHFSISFIRPTI